MLSIEEVRQYRNNQNGCKYLGGGIMGTAYLLPDGRVLKIARKFDGTSDWIEANASEFKLKGKPLDYGPKVWHFEADYETGGWWAVMERVLCMRSLSAHPFVLHRDYRDLEHSPMELVHALKAMGFSHNDLHRGNYGLTLDGRFVAFDPSSADSRRRSKPAQTATQMMMMEEREVMNAFREAAARAVPEKFRAPDDDWMDWAGVVVRHDKQRLQDALLINKAHLQMDRAVPEQFKAPRWHFDTPPHERLPNGPLVVKKAPPNDARDDALFGLGARPMFFDPGPIKPKKRAQWLKPHLGQLPHVHK
jgi:hypothetical protein